MRCGVSVGFVHQTASSPYLLAGVVRQKQITVTMTHAILVSSEEFIARWVFGMWPLCHGSRSFMSGERTD